MSKLLKKDRKHIRMISRGISAAMVPLMFQSCIGYGMYGGPPDRERDITIYGTVVSENEKTPIPGIKVSVKDIHSYTITDEDGYFVIYVPIQDSHKLKFEDIDGIENGSFDMHKMEIVTDNSRTVELYIELTEKEPDEK